MTVAVAANVQRVSPFPVHKTLSQGLVYGNQPSALQTAATAQVTCGLTVVDKKS